MFKLASRTSMRLARIAVSSSSLPVRFFAAGSSSSDIVIPDLVNTLEWVLDSPPNVHQFDEPPIVVEIEHLNNLKVPENDEEELKIIEMKKEASIKNLVSKALEKLSHDGQLFLAHNSPALNFLNNHAEKEALLAEIKKQAK